MNSWTTLLRTSALTLAVLGPLSVSAIAEEAGAGLDPGAPVPEAQPAIAAEAPGDAWQDAFRTDLAAAIGALPEGVRADVRSFYADRSDRPFWTEVGRVGDLAGALDHSADHGIPRDRYPSLTAEADTSDPMAVATTEIEAMRTYLAFAGDLAAGIVRPSSVDPEINITPQRPAASDLLAKLSLPSVSAALEASAPADPDYARLLDEKRRLDGVIAAGGWGATVPGGSTLRAGESEPRVALLRARLARLGYPAAAGEGFGEADFDAGLEAVLKAFQADHGLVDDGAFGEQTRAALNAGADDRLRQVVVNLERMRWMNHDLGARHISVNIPDYTVEMIDGGEVIWQSRTVVGEETKTRTPEFSDTMTHFVVNPTWHIPDSIATRVYLPKLTRDPSVLARSNMSLFTRSGVEINPRLVNFTQYSAQDFPFRIKQNPSSANALGRVKFMFPNQFAIYLHDTPSRDLFNKDRRAFSNGCIRLERPIELSHVLLKGQNSDPAQAMDTWLASGRETYVRLDQPVPVHILYRTVIVDEAGTPRYRADIYGRDRKLFEALSEKGLRLAALQG